MCDGTVINIGEPEHAVFDGSFDGFLCVVYAYYYDKLSPERISSEEFVQNDIFSKLRRIDTNYEKSERVADAIRLKIGPDALKKAYSAFCCPQTSYIDLLKYIVLGFKTGTAIERYLGVDYVVKIEALASKTGREVHRYLGFVRFQETKSGVLYSAITPDNYILPQLAEHFCQRLMNEKWMIHDTKRGLCVIYDGSRYAVCEADNDAYIELSERDEIYQRLWKHFYETIAVESRISTKRLNHILPKKFRSHMTEYTYTNPD